MRWAPVNLFRIEADLKNQAAESRWPEWPPGKGLAPGDKIIRRLSVFHSQSEERRLSSCQRMENGEWKIANRIASTILTPSLRLNDNSCHAEQKTPLPG